MVPPIIGGFDSSYGRVESNIEGVVNIPPKFPIYGDTTCYIDKVT